MLQFVSKWFSIEQCLPYFIGNKNGNNTPRQMKTIQLFIDQQIKSTGRINFDKLKSDIKDHKLTEDDIYSILMWADSFSRMQAFLLFKDQIEDSVLYWKALREAYQNSDNLYQLKHEIIKCFLSIRPHKDHLMNKDELALLSSLPNKVKIFRGMTVSEADSKEYGISWTLDKKVAEFFAFTYGRNHDTADQNKTVVSVDIQKKQIQALFNGRNENEIITTPPQI